MAAIFHGQTIEQTQESVKDFLINSNAIVYTSLMSFNKQWINIYIGNGFKSTDGWYFPREPEKIFEEVKDREEYK